MSRTYRFDCKDGQKLRDGGRVRFPDGTPRAWRNLNMTRPGRREAKRLSYRVLHEADADALTWPLGNRKPHVFYW